MDRPIHKPDYFGDRGDIVGAYAYGVFQDGSTSKVVVINRAYIQKVKAQSRGSDKASSPWVKWPEQMVLKTVARRLEPWVPTAVEWRQGPPLPGVSHVIDPTLPAEPLITEDEVVEGEFVDEDEVA
jgi:recombination protein RecT